MDVNVILQAVGTLGFPIICAIAMGWYVKYITDRNREDIMDAIRSIAGEFKKILFVTHITELKDIFEQKIIVTKNSHGSHIKVA